jgi:hypothetical protein
MIDKPERDVRAEVEAVIEEAIRFALDHREEQDALTNRIHERMIANGRPEFASPAQPDDWIKLAARRATSGIPSRVYKRGCVVVLDHHGECACTGRCQIWEEAVVQRRSAA